MPTFNQIFRSYSDQAQMLNSARDIIIAGENTPYTGKYAGYTIGYGYDIRHQTGNQVVQDFSVAGITINTTLRDNLIAVGDNLVGTNSTINAQFKSQFGASGIDQTKGAALLDVVLPRYRTMLKTKADESSITLSNDGLQAYLISQTYNGGVALFGATQRNAILNNDPGRFLMDVLFGNNKAKDEDGNLVYLSGLQNRRMKDIATASGISYKDSNVGGRYVVTGFDFTNNSYMAESIKDGLGTYGNTVNSLIKNAGSGVTALTNLKATLAVQAKVVTTPGATSNANVYRDLLVGFLQSAQNDSAFKNQAGIRIDYNSPFSSSSDGLIFGDSTRADNSLSYFGLSMDDVLNGSSPLSYSLEEQGYLLLAAKPLQFKFSAYLPGENSLGQYTPPEYVQQVRNWAGSAATHSSPLVLDLDGDGYETYDATSDKAVRFDIDNDGFAERIGWISKDDAHLAKDRNGNGKIDDITELYGDDIMQPFAKLALEDSNKDGIINSSDSTYNQLLIWQDTNEDAITDAGELKTLAQAGIKSISLTETKIGLDTTGDGIGDGAFQNQNHIVSQATFTRTNNTTGNMYDIRYLNIDTDSVYLGSGNDATTSVLIDPETLFLPQMRGYGTLAAFHIAMSTNPQLKQLVKEFVNLSPTDFDQYSSKLLGILYEWADASGIDPNAFASGSGNFIDGRNIAFMDAFFGSPFMQRGQREVVGLEASEDLRLAWDSLVQEIGMRLAVQGPLSGIFQEATYDFLNDEINLNITYATLQSRISSYVADNGSSYAFWVQLGHIMVANRVELGKTTAELASYITGLAGTNVFLADDYKLTATSAAETINGTAGIDFINGLGGNDTIDGGNDSDTLYGEDGDDVINGGAGYDLIDGGAGADTINGGDGNDIIYSGSGIDTVNGGAGDDQIKLGVVEWGSITYTYFGVQYPDFTGSRLYDLNSSNIQFDAVIDGGQGADTLAVLDFAAVFDDAATMVIEPDGDQIPHPMNDVEVGAWVDMTAQTAHLFYGDYYMIFGPNQNNLSANFISTQHVTFQGIENINGSHHRDIIFGDANDNVINGEGGDDQIAGGVGNDNLFGEDGNDTVLGEEGDDFIQASRGNDHIDGGAGFDTLSYAHSYIRTGMKLDFVENVTMGALDEEGQSWAASTVEDESIERFITTAYGDTVNDSGSDRVIDGWKGDDLINGNGGNDTLYGSSGVDTLNGGVGNDSLFGHIDFEQTHQGGINFVLDEGSSDFLTGGAGNDVLRAGWGVDKYYFDTGDGQDIIIRESVIGKLPFDYPAGSGDVVVFGNTIAASSVSFSKVGNNLEVAYGVGQKITIRDCFDAALTFEPFSHFEFANGDASITYRDVMLQLTSAPVANNDSASVEADGTIDIDVLANDTDADAPVFTVAGIASAPAHGTVSINANGTIKYTPHAGYTGSDSFTYTLEDAFGLTDTATVTLNVAAEGALTLRMAQGAVYNGNLGLAAGSTVALVQGPTMGVLTLQANGMFTYQAPEIHTANTNFIYEVTAAGGQKKTLSSSIVVQAPSWIDGQFVLADNEVEVANYNHQTTLYSDQYELESAKLGRRAGGYVAVWSSYNEIGDANDYGVFAQLFDNFDNKVGQVFKVNTITNYQQYAGDVQGLSDGSFLVTWSSSTNSQNSNNHDVYMRRYNADGSAITNSEVMLAGNGNGNQMFSKATVLANGDIVAVWHTWLDATNNQDVYMRRFSKTGTPIGSAVRVNTLLVGSQVEPSVVALNNGGYVVVWQNAQPNDGSLYGVYMRVFDSAGVTTGSDILVNTTTYNNQTEPTAAALADGTFVVTWYSYGQDGDSGSVYGQRFSASGVKLGSEIRINNATVGDQYAVDVIGLIDGGFFAAWVSPDASGTGIYGQRFDANGAKVGTEMLLNDVTNNGQYYPSLLQLENGDIQVSWQSLEHAGTPVVKVRRLINPANTPENQGIFVLADASTSQQTVSSYTHRYTYNPSIPSENGRYYQSETVRLTDGKLLVTWVSYGEDSSSEGVYARLYNADGTAAGAKFMVNTITASQQSYARPIALSGGGFAIAFISNVQGGDAGHGIRLQRFAADGSQVGTDIQVNATTANHQTMPAITQLANGNLMVVWRTNHLNSNRYDLFGQVFDNAGTAVGAEFAVTTQDANRHFPRLATLANGNVVVAFQKGVNSNDVGVTILSATGTVVLAEFTANTTTVGSQREPSVTALKDGSFVVAWTAIGQDGDQGGIYAQRFSAVGAALDNEFRLNSTIAGHQETVSVISLQDGGFFAVWSGRDGSGSGIFGQRFNSTGAMIGAEMRLNDDTANDQGYPSAVELANGDVQVSWQSMLNPVSPTVVTRRLVNVAQSGVMFVAASSGETLVGSAAADTLFGGTGNDILVGNNGNDILDGGAGTDTAMFEDNMSGYSVKADPQGILITRTSDGAVDRLSNIEKLQFADQTVDMGQFPGIPNMTIVQGFHYDGSLTLPAGMTVTLVQGPLVGSFQFTGNGTYRMVAPLGYEGDLTVRYQLTAANGVSIANEFVVTVPRAVAGQYTGQNEIEVAGYTLQRTFYTDLYEKESAKVARRDGGYVVVWSSYGTDGSDYGVYGQLFDANDQKVGTPFLVNTTTANQQYIADVQGLPDGSFIVTWSSSVLFQSTDKNDVYMRKFGADGSALTGQIRLNNSQAGNNVNSKITMLSNGDVLLVWNKWLDATNSHDIYVRRFSSSGASLSSEARVNLVQTGSQVEPAVAILNNGGYAVVWQNSDAMDGSGYGIYMRVFDVAGVAIGNDILVNTTTSNNQTEPAIVALQGGSFVVTWASYAQDASGDGVYFQRFDHNGAKLGSELRVNSTTANDQSAPAITALQDGGFLITWQSQAQDGSLWGIYGQRYDANGLVVGGEFQINQLTAGEQVYPDVIEMPNGDLVFTWQSIDANGVGTVKTRRFTSDGQYAFTGDASDNIFVGGSSDDTVAGSGGNDTFIGNGGTDTIDGGTETDTVVLSGNVANYAITFDANNTISVLDNRPGSPDGNLTLTNIEKIQFANELIDLTGLFPPEKNIILGQNAVVQGQLMVPTGYSLTLLQAPTVGTFNWNGDGTFTYQSPAGYTGDTSFSYRLTTPQGIHQVRNAVISVAAVSVGTGDYSVASASNVQGIAVLDSGSLSLYRQERAEVTALIGGGYVVTWTTNATDGSEQNVHYRLYDSAGTSVTTARANPSTAGVQVGISSTALADGGFVLSWADYQSNATMWRRYNSAGAAQTTAIQVYNSYSEGGRVVQLTNGDLAVLWAGQVGSADTNVYMSRFTTAGVSLGSPVLVSTSTSGVQAVTQVARLADGNIAVTWLDFGGNDGSGQGLLMRVMSPTGTAVSAEQVVNTTTVGHQHGPNITALAGGGFVIVWAAPQDGSFYGVIGQRFDAIGTKVGGEFLVNTYTSGDQYDGSVTALSDGGFFIVWHSSGQDGSGLGVYGQRFNASAQKVGTEIRLNASTTNNQDMPDITELPSGDLIATWRSWHSGSTQVMRSKLVAPASSLTASGDGDPELMLGTAEGDTLSGNGGDDTLIGNGGDDTLNGGSGNDVYRFNLGDESDTIANNDSTGFDIIGFGSSLEKHDLWFSQSGNDLKINILGSTATATTNADMITIQNWYLNDAHKLDEIQLSDGSVLEKSQAEQLVQAMASFNPQAYSSATSITDLPPSVQTAITAAWTS